MLDDSSNSNLSKLAIQKALNCEWEQALEINLELIKEDPQNIECLNRIAKAHFELGHYSDCKKLYEQVLGIDPYNPIAIKNLKRVSSFKKDGNGISSNHNGNTLSASYFLQEPGITKSVTLIKVAEPQKLLTLSAGQIVNLVTKNRGIVITDFQNNYLGALPDDTAHHLLKLIKGGNKYQAFIKSVKPNNLALIIREVFRSKKFKNQASFLDDAKILSYSSDSLSLLAANNDSDGDDSMPESDDISI